MFLRKIMRNILLIQPMHFPQIGFTEIGRLGVNVHIDFLIMLFDLLREEIRKLFRLMLSPVVIILEIRKFSESFEVFFHDHNGGKSEAGKMLGYHVFEVIELVGLFLKLLEKNFWEP